MKDTITIPFGVCSRNPDDQITHFTCYPQHEHCNHSEAECIDPAYNEAYKTYIKWLNSMTSTEPEATRVMTNEEASMNYILCNATPEEFIRLVKDYEL